MQKEDTEPIETTIGILFNTPGSVRLPAKEPQSLGIGRLRESPEAGVIVRTQKRRSVGSIDGKQETIVDNKFFGRRIPAEDVFRMIECSKNATRNKFNIGVSFDEIPVAGDHLHL